MTGDFLSNGFSDKMGRTGGFCTHFESEQELLEILDQFTKNALRFLRFSKYHYKTQRNFEFYIDDDS